MRKKSRFLSFYLLYAHENEFSFRWMTPYKKQQNDKNDPQWFGEWLIDSYFSHPLSNNDDTDNAISLNSIETTYEGVYDP